MVYVPFQIVLKEAKWQQVNAIIESYIVVDTVSKQSY